MACRICVTSLIKADYNSSIVMSHLARVILLCAIAFGHGGIVSVHDDSGVIGDKDGNFDWKRRFTLSMTPPTRIAATPAACCSKTAGS
jgi:hypothetical protein